MNIFFNRIIISALFAFTVVLACKKEVALRPGPPPPVDPPPADTGFYSIKVRAEIRVGGILYDSIPASLKITAWDANGTAYYRNTQLAPGVNEVFLPKAQLRFRLELNKWGVHKDTIFTKQEIREGAVYLLSAWKGAKQPKEEVTYTYIAGTYRPIAKQEFVYNATMLAEIKFFSIFLNGGTEVFQQTRSEKFIYQDKRLVKVVETYLISTGGESGERHYQYDEHGRITRTIYIYPSQQFTYRNTYAQAGPMTVIDVYPELQNNPLETRYQFKIVKGNRVQSKTLTNSGTYGYTYSYGFDINPYAHINWPDIYFAHQSKNNHLTEHFFDGTQSAEETRFEYQVDADGYVTQMIRKERDPFASTFLIISKKVFTY
ncbi:MAG TPA: hypothetical protein VM935_03650 [Chitinophagaceae bacterium]|nr:hypothetical protein [Chitinophagaceae bacterium]